MDHRDETYVALLFEGFPHIGRIDRAIVGYLDLNRILAAVISEVARVPCSKHT